jgi:hypothetical protein
MITTQIKKLGLASAQESAHRVIRWLLEQGHKFGQILADCLICINSFLVYRDTIPGSQTTTGDLS